MSIPGNQRASAAGPSASAWAPGCSYFCTRVTSFENDPSHHPELVKAILDLPPIQDQKILSAVKGDVMRRFLVYLNRPEFQAKVQAHPAELANAVVAFLKQINADNAQITQFIQGRP